jgi:hypothetical protein
MERKGSMAWDEFFESAGFGLYGLVGRARRACVDDNDLEKKRKEIVKCVGR